VPVCAGIVTHESRGIDTSVGACPNSWCTSMIVSVRWPSVLPVRSCRCSFLVRPSRLSDPTSSHTDPLVCAIGSGEAAGVFSSEVAA
jgi:hypothetical protein